MSTHRRRGLCPGDWCIDANSKYHYSFLPESSRDSDCPACHELGPVPAETKAVILQKAKRLVEAVILQKAKRLAALEGLLQWSTEHGYQIRWVSSEGMIRFIFEHLDQFVEEYAIDGDVQAAARRVRNLVFPTKEPT